MQCYFCGICGDDNIFIKIMDYQGEQVMCCNDCSLKILKRLLDNRIIIPETVMQLAD